MSQIMPNRSTNDVEFAVADGHTSTPTMHLQTHIGAQCQADVVTLRTLDAKLSALNTRELLKGTVIDFDQPRPIRQELTLRVGHVEAAGRPMLRVAVRVNRPKHFHHAIAAQMHRQATVGNVHFAHRLLLSRQYADLSVALQPRQPLPAPCR